MKLTGMMPTSRRAAILTALCLAAILPARAQDAYPNRPIRLVVPFTPGGVTDSSGRLIADFLGRRLGQQVIVDNKPGASGNIGTAQVAAATPDGYTKSTQAATLKSPWPVTFSPRVAVPGLPGQHHSPLRRGDWATFQAMACSRPPEPTIKTFIGVPLSAALRRFPLQIRSLYFPG
jgi:hypothetical protein